VWSRFESELAQNSSALMEPIAFRTRNVILASGLGCLEGGQEFAASDGGTHSLREDDTGLAC
jgi:hypothetical protein